jgi:hypothetical protein
MRCLRNDIFLLKLFNGVYSLADPTGITLISARRNHDAGTKSGEEEMKGALHLASLETVFHAPLFFWFTLPSRR